jgi:hypothetical protein
MTSEPQGVTTISIQLKKSSEKLFFSLFHCSRHGGYCEEYIYRRVDV